MTISHAVVGLSAFLLVAGVQAAEYYFSFDVPFGQYERQFKMKTPGDGTLSCTVFIEKEYRGEKWVPAVILAAAEDDAEDDTLFLSSSTEPNGGSRTFHLRTFNQAKPVIDKTLWKAPDEKGVYKMAVSWYANGAIGYQYGIYASWQEKQFVEKPGFSTRHVSVHASGVKGSALCYVHAK